MIYWRAYVAATTGATVLLVGTVPLLDLVLTGAGLRGVLPLAIMILYAFGGTLLGGMTGLWVLRTLNWHRLRSLQCVWFVVGLALGAGVCAAMPWPYPVLAPAVIGLIGAASATLYWFLERTTA